MKLKKTFDAVKPEACCAERARPKAGCSLCKTAFLSAILIALQASSASGSASSVARALLASDVHADHHVHAHDHEHDHVHVHVHARSHDARVHSHDAREHTHRLRVLQDVTDAAAEGDGANLTAQDAGTNHTDAGTNHTDAGTNHVDHGVDGELDNHDDHEHEHEHEHSERLGDGKPWGEVIVASLLINLASLTGVAFVVCGLVSKAICGDMLKSSSSGLVSHNIIPSFACGALLATCVFFIFPEAFFMLVDDAESNTNDNNGHEEDIDSVVAWKFGAAVIGGFLLPVLSSFIFPHADDHEPEACSTCQNEEANRLTGVPPKDEASVVGMQISKAAELGDGSTSNLINTDDACGLPDCHHGTRTDDVDESGAAPKVEPHLDPNLEPPKPINYSLALSIILGDFFHNFTDGILIGTSFMVCNRELAIAISAATVYHELAHQLANFYILTTHCNLRIWVALVLNFIAGLSLLLGALIILAVDNISQSTTGAILAMGGGVYLYIAISECFIRARQAFHTATGKAWFLASFVGGVLPIGLVLLNHGHCDG